MRVVLACLAFVVMSLALLRACMHVSLAWDVWYYHMPFAARHAGMLPASEVRFDALGEARYLGFPALSEIVQGFLWKWSGRAQAANLLSWGSLLACAILARKVARVSLGALLVAWMAIPVVHIHASLAYVDLPANACATVLVLLVHRSLSSRLSRAWIVTAIVLAAIACNIKLLLAPVVFLSLLAIVWRTRSLLPVACSPIVFASQLANLVRFHNPAYPVQTLGLPGLEAPYAEVSARFESWPQPLRFVVSILEVGIRSFSDEHRYTVDQWMPPEMDGLRMGGFLNVYVIALAIACVLFARKDKRAAIVMLSLTAIVSVMPQSHVLRYYMVWMMTLVVVALKLAGKRKVVAIVSTCALALTIWSTRAIYLTPDPYSLEDVMREHVDRSVVNAIPENGHACIARAPFSVLYASRFHPGRNYSIAIQDECP